MKNQSNYFTPTGFRVSPEYKSIFDDEKKRNIVKKSGQFDLYEFIQASECQTDLSMLRQQLASTGQIPSVSSDVIDYSLFPEDIHELNNMVNSVEDRFNKLPDSIKVVFGDKDKFVASLVKGTYEDDIIAYYKSTNPKITPNVDEDKIKKDEVIKDE